MFVGHYGIGLAAKRFAPQTSLGTLILAALLADLLAWTLVVAGTEHFAIQPGITATNSLDLYDYPISHSLATDAVWGALLAAGYYFVRRYWIGSLLIFLVVLSHWFLDLIAHRADMPLLPGLPRYYGLGLYNSRIGMIAVEGLIWLGGVVIYLRATTSKKRLGTAVLWIGVAALTWVWLFSLRGLPPPGTIVQVATWSLAFMSVTVVWAYWIDDMRVVKDE
ncbi:MAG TPA: hypothetical protein VEI01_25450 [Terriglobales bacterium]|nr:hypothetical protein [Terriglobales bacterium]